MTVIFNAFEMFQIAEQIERNGAKFYRRAAEIFDDPRVRKLFTGLALWETQHEQVFVDMRKQLSEQSREMEAFKPEQTPPDPKAMAGLATFGIRSDPSDELSGTEGEVDILRKAIEKEKDSIVFYSGLKDFVPARAGKDKIDDIIKEEIRHIRILTQSLEQRQ